MSTRLYQNLLSINVAATRTAAPYTFCFENIFFFSLTAISLSKESKAVHSYEWRILTQRSNSVARISFWVRPSPWCSKWRCYKRFSWPFSSPCHHQVTSPSIDSFLFFLLNLNFFYGHYFFLLIWVFLEISLMGISSLAT